MSGFEDSGAAAMRYTEIKMSPYVKDMAFSYIKHVPWEALELDSEPLYLPCIVPLGLIGEGLTQGIACHTTKMPRYNYNDLLSRLYQLLTKSKLETIEPIIAQCDIMPTEQTSYGDVLTSGKGAIWVCPKYTVHDTCIDVFGKNPINGFSFLKRLCKDYPDMINADDLGGDQICVRVYSLKGRVTHQFINAVVKAITTKIHFICNVVMDDGKVQTKSIDSLLVGSFNVWKAAWRHQLEERLDGLKRKKHQLEVIKIVRECYDPSQKRVDDIIAVFKTNIAKYPNVTIDEVKSAVSKGRIKELIEAHLDFAAIAKAIKAQELEITNLDSTAVKKVKALML